MKKQKKSEAKSVSPPNYVGNILTYPGIKINRSRDSYYKVDLEFYGLDHSGPSYEGRVFINNPRANEKTKLNVNSGYAGSYHIFGHGGCFGDIGHCDVTSRRFYDHRSQHPLTPAFKGIDITKIFNRVIRNNKELVITIVPIMSVGGRLSDMKDVVKLKRIRINTYENITKV